MRADERRVRKKLWSERLKEANFLGVKNGWQKNSDEMERVAGQAGAAAVAGAAAEGLPAI